MTRAQTDSLHRLLEGESFQALAGEVFNDPELQASGGLLPPFTFDEMDPDFEDAAFTLLIGEISEPVRTPQRKFDIVVGFFAKAPCSRFSGSLLKGAICTVVLTFRGSLFWVVSPCVAGYDCQGVCP